MMLQSLSRARLATPCTIPNIIALRRLSQQPTPTPVPTAGERVLQAQPGQTSRVPPRVQQRLQDPRQGRSGSFYLLILGSSLLAVPPIAYFYWQHREAHMKAKKEAMLRDIQARVAAR